MDNLVTTYQHIADILSFEFSNSKLEKKLSDPSFDWDAIVKEGSKHLVLPALYCRLKAKHLLHLLPAELNYYLEEITSINRNRNKSILKQVQTISQHLNENKIEHVFLKGSALLALGCFEDNAERMLGDIDILVANDQLGEAYQILINNGYLSTEQPLGHKFFGHTHLPRLKPTHDIASIEIHNKLFMSYKYDPLSHDSIFNKKKQHGSIYIPSQKHLLLHNILSFQINDKGAIYNSINFRSAYDAISLQRNSAYDINWDKNKYILSYFKYTSLFFKDIKTATKVKSNFLTSFYLFKLTHIRFYKFWNKLIELSNLLPILLKRLSLFISNKSYRKAIINDRKRIYAYFKSNFNNF